LSFYDRFIYTKKKNDFTYVTFLIGVILALLTLLMLLYSNFTG